MRTKDCGLAAALNVNGYRPTVTVQSGRSFFEFSGDEAALAQAQADYYVGAMRVDPRQYNQAVRDLLALAKAVSRG